MSGLFKSSVDEYLLGDDVYHNSAFGFNRWNKYVEVEAKKARKK
jgi:hypothetical protein